ncbi:hypothetical protein [Leptolinea tardivitalis]|uniref:PDGLE domain-containing protein n=1 Tax=Leptolinea tardivitalis TaxID=229920 RepID=A0A0P6X8J5_9CHLR|nr:hypothetical protein [Leptolinea tardivitalis]KPL70556.1 hypothetical protein ADM99_15695 [Leptolinea tardivitalis]GAP22164.1 hypothetical protein LTAR_02387 [Leptolinea tardivitalis]
MKKVIVRILILTAIIGLLAAALIAIVNTSAGYSLISSDDRSEGIAPNPSFSTSPSTTQPGTNLPPEGFREHDQQNPGVIGSIEVLKNMGIIAAITFVIVLFRAGFKKLRQVLSKKQPVSVR